jgi:hypothetical protein
MPQQLLLWALLLIFKVAKSQPDWCLQYNCSFNYSTLLKCANKQPVSIASGVRFSV